jgi:acyl-coenzyme A thioesterase PaaI-like protein
MELNDTTDYQRCFVCGQRNPYGLHLTFRREDDSVVADFLPREEHQGFPGVIHGGIVAAVLDEALNRTSLLSSQPAWTMTGRLEVRYRRYVPYGERLRVRAIGIVSLAKGRAGEQEREKRKLKSLHVV